jgi:hypothetical protein
VLGPSNSRIGSNLRPAINRNKFLVEQLDRKYNQIWRRSSTILEQELRECDKIQFPYCLINECLVWPLLMSLHPDQFILFIFSNLVSWGAQIQKCWLTTYSTFTLIHFLNNSIVFSLEYDVHCRCQTLHCCTSCAKIGTSL